MKAGRENKSVSPGTSMNEQAWELIAFPVECRLKLNIYECKRTDPRFSDYFTEALREQCGCSCTAATVKP